jgi:hypothetical protein
MRVPERISGVSRSGSRAGRGPELRLTMLALSTRTALASAQYGWDARQKPATLKPALSRKRAPIGGRVAVLPELASCLAGQMGPVGAGDDRVRDAAQDRGQGWP